MQSTSIKIFFITIIIKLSHQITLNPNAYVNNNNNDDSRLTTLEIISKYGYPAEKHKIITEDGYFITLHRIPYGRSANISAGTGERPAVLLQHCILCSSAVFVLTGPKKALGFILADKGYDVWMGNARGTRYSKGHLEFPMKDPKYWEFSWHEMGVYDVAAEIDYILKRISQDKIYYVGHSMGNTMMYALLSERPEYNQKINLFISLSPVAYMSHMRSTMFRIIYGPLALILRTMGFQEFVPHNGLVSRMGKMLCELQATSSVICSNALFLISGYNSHQLDMGMLPTIFGHIPAGTSVSSLVHYGQSMITGDFRLYDYGVKENLRRYKARIPPKYNLSRVDAPCAFFHSTNDWLSDPADVSKLEDQLPNLVISQKVSLSSFNHMDYLFAKDVVQLLYKDLMTVLKKY